MFLKVEYVASKAAVVTVAVVTASSKILLTSARGSPWTTCKDEEINHDLVAECIITGVRDHRSCGRVSCTNLHVFTFGYMFDLVDEYPDGAMDNPRCERV